MDGWTDAQTRGQDGSCQHLPWPVRNFVGLHAWQRDKHDTTEDRRQRKKCHFGISFDRALILTGLPRSLLTMYSNIEYRILVESNRGKMNAVLFFFFFALLFWQKKWPQTGKKVIKKLKMNTAFFPRQTSKASFFFFVKSIFFPAAAPFL